MNAGVLHLNNPCTGKQGQEEEEFKVIFGHKALEKKQTKPKQDYVQQGSTPRVHVVAKDQQQKGKCVPENLGLCSPSAGTARYSFLLQGPLAPGSQLVKGTSSWCSFSKGAMQGSHFLVLEVSLTQFLSLLTCFGWCLVSNGRAEVELRTERMWIRRLRKG